MAMSTIRAFRQPPPRRRRDRRGRGLRGPLAWPALPLMRTRSDRFDEAVLAAMERIERRLGQRLEAVEVAVELVPPSDPNPWEEHRIPLCRCFPPEGRLPGRIVLYRRPIETRLQPVVDNLVTEQVAELLGVTPESIDPGYPREP